MEGQTAEKQKSECIKFVSGDPYNKTVEEVKLNGSTSPAPAHQRFEVRCHAGNAGHLEAASEAVSVRIGQLVRREGKEEFWSSLLVECKQQENGSLAIEVIVFHPEWDEPVRIASIESSPSERGARTPILRCDFEQKRL
jgi:hypothetical protein